MLAHMAKITVLLFVAYLFPDCGRVVMAILWVNHVTCYHVIAETPKSPDVRFSFDTATSIELQTTKNKMIAITKQVMLPYLS